MNAHAEEPVQRREFHTFASDGLGVSIFRAISLSRLIPLFSLTPFPIVSVPNHVHPSTRLLTPATLAPPILTLSSFVPVPNALAQFVPVPIEEVLAMAPLDQGRFANDYQHHQHALDLDRLTQQELVNQDLLEELERLAQDNRTLRHKNDQLRHSRDILDVRVHHVENFNNDLRQENRRLSRFTESIAYIVDSTRHTGRVPVDVGAHLRNLPLPIFDDGSDSLLVTDYADDLVFLGARRPGRADRRRPTGVERSVFGSDGDFNSNEIVQEEADVPKAQVQEEENDGDDESDSDDVEFLDEVEMVQA